MSKKLSHLIQNIGQVLDLTHLASFIRISVQGLENDAFAALNPPVPIFEGFTKQNRAVLVGGGGRSQGPKLSRKALEVHNNVY